MFINHGGWRRRFVVMSPLHSSIDWSDPTQTTLRSMMLSTRPWRRAPFQEDVACVAPFGDADYFAAVQHDERANVFVGHHLKCVVHFVVGTEGPYLIALVFQDMTVCRHDGTKARN